ncbi:MAG TPA: sulfurtransferase [Polyangiales bacterium]|nr:sulfurtransferase [Polyangiales bacterium]
MPLDPVLPVSALGSLRDLALIDCRPDEAAYRAGHVPGARHAQLERDLSAPAHNPARGGRHPLPDARDFARTLGRWGITPRSHVVAYDDQNGANAAARLWWMLRALGHERVQVLDGGLPALVAAGLTAEVPEPSAEPPYPAAAFTLPLADIDEVESARSAPDRRVIDVRAAFRYRGEKEPIDPIAGHIPGARNAPLTDNLRADGTFKSADELRELYARALDGVSPERTILHCGSGVTACHSLLALERAGLPGAKLYVGSWGEWCRNPQRPREPAG